jgi:general secretion pathway protein L
MPGKILGIDINKDFISAVQIIGGMKGYQILSHATVMVGDNPADALNEIAQLMDLKGETCIASIDGSHIAYQNLTMPFKDPRKIKQTLPFELEPLLPFPIEDIVVDFNIVKSAEQSEILAVTARKSLIAEYLQTTKSFGIHPRVIDISPVPVVYWLLSQIETPDCGVVIDIGQKKCAFALFIDRRVALVRNTSLENGGRPSPSMPDENADTREFVEYISKTLHRDLKNTLRSLSAQKKTEIKPEKIFITGIGSQYPRLIESLVEQTETPVEQIDVSRDGRLRMDYNSAESWNPGFMGGALSLALRESKKGHGFNLRKGEFEVKKGFLRSVRELRKIGIALLVVVAFLMIDAGTDYILVKKRYQAAEQRNAGLFRQLFPEVKDVKFPLQQLKQKIDELKKSAVTIPTDINREHKMLDLINDISQRIPKNVDIDVSSLFIDSETVRISGQTDSISTVNSFKTELEPSSFFSEVVIMPVKLDKTGKRVDFELKLQRK